MNILSAVTLRMIHKNSVLITACHPESYRTKVLMETYSFHSLDGIWKGNDEAQNQRRAPTALRM